MFEGSANYWQSKSQRAEAEKKHSGFGAEVALLRHAQGQAQTALEVGRKGTVLSSLIGVAEGLLQAVSDRLAVRGCLCLIPSVNGRRPVQYS